MATLSTADIFNGIFEDTPKFFHYERDVLEIVCSLHRLKNDMSITHSIMELPESIDYSIITDQDRELAEKIRRYFQNTFTLRRLQNRFMSPWMRTVEEILSSEKQISSDKLKVAVKLPIHYKENLIVDEVVKTHQSLPESKNNKLDSVDESVRFVKHYKRNTIKNRSDVFFFEDSKNRLIKVEVKNGDVSLPLWKHFVGTSETIKIKGSLIVKKQPGHLFSLYELTNDYEIS